MAFPQFPKTVWTYPPSVTALTFSAVAHVAVFGLFTFTLTQRPESPQPTMSFLGSLLAPQDVLSPIFSETTTQYATPIPLVSRRISRSKVNPNTLTAVAKPIAGEETLSDNKSFQKSFFPTITVGPASAAIPAVDLQTPKMNPAGVYQTTEKNDFLKP